MIARAFMKIAAITVSFSLAMPIVSVAALGVAKSTPPPKPTSDTYKKDGYSATYWWKADLTKYLNENFSLTKYEINGAEIIVPNLVKNTPPNSATTYVVVPDTQVEQPLSTEPKKAVETRPVETKKAETKPAVTTTKPAETKKTVATTPKPVETKPVATTAKPAETKKAETKPVATTAKPTETKPVATQPVATQPPATKKTFTFTTYGYGHGVGLSQNGANHYATLSGWNYKQILKHYYTGIEIKNTDTADKDVFTCNGVSGNALDIVSRIVMNEIGGDFHDEAIKAQAVAVYTFIKYHGGSAGSLRMQSTASERVKTLVKSVIGEACYYNGSFALTMFSASSGGATASVQDIYTEYLPYLQSVDAPYDLTHDTHYGRFSSGSVKTFDADTVKTKIENLTGVKLTGDPSTWFKYNLGDGGYVASVTVGGKTTVKGNDFRVALGLKSPKFTVAIT